VDVEIQSYHSQIKIVHTSTPNKRPHTIQLKTYTFMGKELETNYYYFEELFSGKRRQICKIIFSETSKSFEKGSYHYSLSIYCNYFDCHYYAAFPSYFSSFIVL